MTAVAQATFAELEYGAKKRKTRREKFLERMEGLVPWQELEDAIRPHYPKTPAGRGRRPYPLSAMLRVHCMQLFYNASDPGMEDMLYEVEPARRFAGLKLDALPDETTILKFRHLLEKHGLGEKLMAVVNASLAARGLTLREGRWWTRASWRRRRRRRTARGSGTLRCIRRRRGTSGTSG